MYRYLIGFLIEGGPMGRAVISIVNPIETNSNIEEIENSLSKDNDLKQIGIFSFTLMKKYNE